MAQATNSAVEAANCLTLPIESCNVSFRYFKQRYGPPKQVRHVASVPPKYRADARGAHFAWSCILDIDAGPKSAEEILITDYKDLSLELDYPSREVAGALEFIIPLCPNLKSLNLVVSEAHRLDPQQHFDIGLNIAKAIEVLRTNDLRLTALVISGHLLSNHRWRKPMEDYVQWAGTNTLKLNLVNCATLDWEGAHSFANALANGRLPFSRLHIYSNDACIENHLLEAFLSVDEQAHCIKELRLVSIERSSSQTKPTCIKEHYQMLNIKELLKPGQLLQNCTVFAMVGRGLTMQGLVQFSEICNMVMSNGVRQNCPAFLVECRTRLLSPALSRRQPLDEMMMRATRLVSKTRFRPFSLCMGATALETKIVGTLERPVDVVSALAREMAIFMPTISDDVVVATNDKRNVLTRELAEIVESHILHQYTQTYLIWPSTRRNKNPNEIRPEFRQAVNMRGNTTLSSTGKFLTDEGKRFPIGIDGRRVKQKIAHSITWVAEDF